MNGCSSPPAPKCQRHNSAYGIDDLNRGAIRGAIRGASAGRCADTADR